MRCRTFALTAERNNCAFVYVQGLRVWRVRNAQGQGTGISSRSLSCAVSSDVDLIEVELISEYLDGANKSCGNSEARIEQGVLGSLDPADYRESRIT